MYTSPISSTVFMCSISMALTKATWFKNWTLVLRNCKKKQNISYFVKSAWYMYTFRRIPNVLSYTFAVRYVCVSFLFTLCLRRNCRQSRKMSTRLTFISKRGTDAFRFVITQLTKRKWRGWLREMELQKA